jgi:surface polysaccharide O-acyltransferase-like enzyme
MKRNMSLDLLKILSCFAVVVLHVSGIITTTNNENTISHIIYYTAGFAVPIFFMVNGYLLLNKEKITYKYILKKVVNILSVIFLWNIVIFLDNLILKGEIVNPFKMLLRNLIQRDYFWQFWFFGALILIYCVLPIIHKYFTEFKTAILITSTFITISLLIDLISLIRSFSGNSIIQINVMETFRLWTWFSYYLIGGLLGKKQTRDYILKHISPLVNWIILITMIIIINIYQYNVGHYLYNTPSGEYFYENIFTFIWTVSLFVLVYRQNFSKYKNKTIEVISNNAMGIYIIHVTILNIMRRFYEFNTVITNILLIFIVFSISLIASIIINKLPLVNRLVKI